MKRLFYYISILYLCIIILMGCSMFKTVPAEQTQPTNTTSVVKFPDGTTYLFKDGKMYNFKTK